MPAEPALCDQTGMNKLRQVEREGRGLYPEPLGNNTGPQTCGPGGNQQSKQRQPGFLSERAEGGNRTFFVHHRDIPCFNDDQMDFARHTSRGHFENC